MKTRKDARLRRARKTREQIKRLAVNRLCVFRSPKHLYAQIIEPAAGHVLVSASTTESEIRSQLNNGGNVGAATLLGKHLAQKATGLGVRRVAFDRSGYKYHGRIKALADAARENGLEF